MLQSQDIGIKKASTLSVEAFNQNLTSKRTSKSNKKLPPFGRDLFYRLSQGQCPQNVVWIACGIKAWDRVRNDLKRSDSAALCLPYGQDPTRYHWPVTGLSCVAAHTGGCDAATLKALGTELILAGADRAILLDVEDELGVPVAYFRPTECTA
jgi:hypothetical protein